MTYKSGKIFSKCGNWYFIVKPILKNVLPTWTNNIFAAFPRNVWIAIVVRYTHFRTSPPSTFRNAVGTTRKTALWKSLCVYLELVFSEIKCTVLDVSRLIPSACVLQYIHKFKTWRVIFIIVDVWGVLWIFFFV